MHLAWTHKPAHLASKPVHLANKKLLAKILAKDLPEIEEMAEWVKKELEGGGDVTPAEVKAELEKWEANTGNEISEDEWELVRASWHYADIDDDGKVTADELACVIENVDCKQFGKIGKKYKHPSEEDMAAVEAWIRDQLKDGGTITWGEMKQAVEPFELTKKQMALLKALFNVVDSNDNKEVEAEELEKFIKSL